MRKYVLGFMFSPGKDHVVLIRKNKPDWQKGKWNGVGGKVEEGELYIDAMRREFEEETGVIAWEWTPFAHMHGHAWEVVCFVCFDEQYSKIKTTTDEPVDIFEVSGIHQRFPDLNIIPNLAWLIPMALAEENVRAEIYHPDQP